MKYTLPFILTTIIAISSYGCSSDDSDSASTQTPAGKETIFQPQIDALEKAKKVEDIVKQQDLSTRQAIEQESGNK